MTVRVVHIRSPQTPTRAEQEPACSTRAQRPAAACPQQARQWKARPTRTRWGRSASPHRGARAGSWPGILSSQCQPLETSAEKILLERCLQSKEMNKTAFLDYNSQRTHFTYPKHTARSFWCVHRYVQPSPWSFSEHFVTQKRNTYPWGITHPNRLSLQPWLRTLLGWQTSSGFISEQRPDPAPGTCVHLLHPCSSSKDSSSGSSWVPAGVPLGPCCVWGQTWPGCSQCSQGGPGLGGGSQACCGHPGRFPTHTEGARLPE